MKKKNNTVKVGGVWTRGECCDSSQKGYKIYFVHSISFIYIVYISKVYLPRVCN